VTRYWHKYLMIVTCMCTLLIFVCANLLGYRRGPHAPEGPGAEMFGVAIEQALLDMTVLCTKKAKVREVHVACVRNGWILHTLMSNPFIH
jgi:hypothetical protein